MPEIQVNIGGRSFDVACAPGEEAHLQKAAKMLDTETEILTKHIGRLPEARMLLMAGLMLADRTSGLEERAKTAETALEETQAKLHDLRRRRGTGVRIGRGGAGGDVDRLSDTIGLSWTGGRGG